MGLMYTWNKILNSQKGMHIGLPDLANKSTGHPITAEYQINNSNEILA